MNRYFFICFIFLISCSQENELDGFWTNGTDTFLFQNDSIFGILLKSKYFISNKKIKIDDSNLQFTLNENLLFLKSDIYDNMELHKSKFNHLFDEQTQNLGPITLPTGHTHFSKRSKMIRDENKIHINTKGELFFNFKNMDLSEIEKKLNQAKYRNSINLAINENFLFSDFQKFYNQISHHDSLNTTFYHTTKDIDYFSPKCHIWEKWNNTSSQLKIPMMYSDYFPDSVFNNFTKLHFRKESNKMTLNHRFLDSIAIFKSADSMYSKRPDKTVFVIHISKDFTYGNFVTSYSLYNKIIDKKRNQHAQKKYGYSITDLRNKKDANRLKLDSIFRLFPKNILIDDPYNKHVHPMYPHSNI